MIKLPDDVFLPADSDDSGQADELDATFNIEEIENGDAEVLAGEAPAPELNQQLVEDTEAFFRPGGTLQKAAEMDGRPCEFRPQQLAMGKAIAQAMISGRNLAVEAPTGVGKSFAYLAPLVFRSRYAARAALVSTETINLQEQLIQKDIPLLRELTGIDFKAALAKGRANYLCLRRLTLAGDAQSSSLLPAESLANDLERLYLWSESTETGERDDVGFRMGPELWPLVCCEVGSCPGPKCAFYRKCFYYKARQQWDKADIVVANHALFFTDLAMRGEGDGATLLPNYGTVVIDEAHTLEDNAAEHLGLHLSRAAVVGTLNRLFNPDNARGLLMRAGKETLALRQTIAALRDEAYGFFQPFETYLRENPDRENGGGSRRLFDCSSYSDNLSASLMVLVRLLLEFVENEEDEAFKAEMQSQLDRCRAFVDGIKNFIGMTMRDAVYYVEQERGGVVLNAAPLNVADILNRILFNQDFPVILSSATLTVRGDFDFYCGRTGFDNGDTLLLDSPFRRDQAQVRIPQTMPEPNLRTEYGAALLEQIPRYIEETGGKAFVLFTSYTALRSCSEALRPYFAERGITLLVQGEELTRSAMLRSFREDVNSVLFGTDSFWTGVDVPGEALSNVIITKLPFPSPGQPLVAARCEKIENTGKNAFREYSLPAAVLKFRQGVGRLIRSRNDRGIIVILDRRVLSKGYGRSFLDSLPYPVTVDRNS